MTPNEEEEDYEQLIAAIDELPLARFLDELDELAIHQRRNKLVRGFMSRLAVTTAAITLAWHLEWISFGWGILTAWCAWSCWTHWLINKWIQGGPSSCG